MKNCTINMEFCARYGLRRADNNLQRAQRIAETKYHSLVMRTPSRSEISSINALIDEIYSWSKSAQPTSSVA